MHHQLLGWVVLWEDREGGEDLTDLEPASILVTVMRVPAQPQPVRPIRKLQLSSLSSPQQLFWGQERSMKVPPDGYFNDTIVWPWALCPHTE